MSASSSSPSARSALHATATRRSPSSRERSLHARFARSAPTQATDVDDVTVHVLVAARRPDRRRDDERAPTTRRCATPPRARGRGGRGGRGARAAATTPASPEPAAVPRARRPRPARPRALDPGRRGAPRWPPRSPSPPSTAPRRSASGRAGEVRTAIASSTGIARARRGHRRVLQGRLPRRRRAQRLRDRRRRRPRRRSTPTRSRGARPRRVPRGDARRARRRARTRSSSARTPSATLLEFLGGLAFNGLAHAEGRGALGGRLGTRVAAPAINLSDSPRFAGTLPRAFDAEGVPKAPLPLIQDGVAHRVVHDPRSAARAGDGARSTGHATAPGGSPFGPAPTNLVLDRRRRGRRGRARRADRARPLREPLLVRQPGATRRRRC